MNLRSVMWTNEAVGRKKVDEKIDSHRVHGKGSDTRTLIDKYYLAMACFRVERRRSPIPYPRKIELGIDCQI